ncbi:uncharacterized protein GGS25DRAFT_46516 [Hypoxylon fragiforme]|uniref:uncharacterized protein n=1 Tax=Hypoxylon fragiforme TaxID=63214 RepID=UPI0020C61FFC|nr:uncharacterized protein GGS25DRAFT_46516 [Hypoxylon fragiforme]KAI2614387.1 hypothetical protein GGS25DRAFT_46516 [Hypoxylon fragiforme]
MGKLRGDQDLRHCLLQALLVAWLSSPLSLGGFRLDVLLLQNPSNEDAIMEWSNLELRKHCTSTISILTFCLMVM